MHSVRQVEENHADTPLMQLNISYEQISRGPREGYQMKEKIELGILSSMAGTACPLCASKTIRGALFCSRCGRSGRLYYDPAEVREKRKEVYIPRQLVR